MKLIMFDRNLDVNGKRVNLIDSKNNFVLSNKLWQVTMQAARKIKYVHNAHNKCRNSLQVLRKLIASVYVFGHIGPKTMIKR